MGQLRLQEATIQKHWGGRLEIGSANSVVELNNNANKKPPIKLQPGAIRPLQLLLQNHGGSELLGKMTGYTYVLHKSLRKGCSCRRGEQLPAQLRTSQPTPSTSLLKRVLFSKERVTLLQEHKRWCDALMISMKALKWLFSCASPSSIKLSLAWHSDCIL